MIQITRKKVIIFVSLVLIIFALPLIVYVSQKQQESRSRAAPVVTDDTPVAIIDGKQITKGEVRKVAEEQMDPSLVDEQALKDGLAILEERKILDKAEKDLSITLDQDRVEELKAQEFSDEDSRYEVLRDQVRLKATKSRQALSISFWNPPTNSLSALSTTEQTAAAAQLSSGTSALKEAETRMKNGEDVFEIADSLLKKYTSLNSVLAVNGYILDKLDAPKREIAQQPPIYEFGDSGLDQTTLSSLFGMSVDEVKRIAGSETNRGEVVFKLVSSGKDNGPETYDAWLTQQKDLLVKDLGVL